MTKRVLICGGPRTGKTTYGKKLAEELGCKLISTDDFIDLGWSECSAHVAELIHDPDGAWVIEGVAAVRALRKTLEHSVGKMCEQVIWLTKPYGKRSAGQESMAKGCWTVWKGIEKDVIDRGIEVLYEVEDDAS